MTISQTSKSNWVSTDVLTATEMNKYGADIASIISYCNATRSVAEGGTGATTLAANRLLLGNGTSALTSLASGTSGYVLKSNGSSAPTWVAQSTLAAGTATTATSASKLTTARNLKVNLASTSSASFNGSADATGIGVSGALAVGNGGTGSTTASAARTALGITPANIGAAATSHTHAASDIASGTLAVARGGTGVSSLASDAYALLGCTSGGGVTTHNVFDWSALLGIQSPADSDTIDFNDLSAYGTYNKALFLDTRDISKYTHAPVNSSFAKGWIFEFNGISDNSNSKTQILITICKTNSDMRACQVFVRTYDDNTWIPNDADGYHDANGWKKLNFATSAW